MSDLVEELAERGRSAAPDDLACLVNLLIESLHETPVVGIEETWGREIERRVAAFERGEAKLCDAEDVFAEAGRIAL